MGCTVSMHKQVSVSKQRNFLPLFFLSVESYNIHMKTNNTLYKKGVAKPVAILLILAGVLIALAAIGMYSSMQEQTIKPTVQTPALTPTPANPVTPPVAIACGIHIASPVSNVPIISPVTISGYVDSQCHWGAFEGQTGTVIVYDATNTALSPEIPLTAESEWMQQVVNFKVKVGFSRPNTSQGYLLFSNEDVSGEHPETYTYPVIFQM